MPETIHQQTIARNQEQYQKTKWMLVLAMALTLAADASYLVADLQHYSSAGTSRHDSAYRAAGDLQCPALPWPAEMKRLSSCALCRR